MLARAHAKVGEVATIAGYLGAASEAFENAMGRFGIAYADQAERDHAALKAAVRARQRSPSSRKSNVSDTSRRQPFVSQTK